MVVLHRGFLAHHQTMDDDPEPAKFPAQVFVNQEMSVDGWTLQLLHATIRMNVAVCLADFEVVFILWKRALSANVPNTQGSHQ